jgi:hypothetical protein
MVFGGRIPPMDAMKGVGDHRRWELGSWSFRDKCVPKLELGNEGIKW